MESAYCHVLVHSDDCYLLGMKWQVKYFIDLALPFGLRSAPYIFSSFADLLVWILTHNYGINFLLHYLDDFHTLGPPNSPVCQNNVNTCVQLFSELGIPLHRNKLERPSTCLTVLGIELDSMTLQAHLPQDKFDRIAALLESWPVKQHCTWKELESLIGHLQHACKVIPQGRTFLHVWQMINLLSAFRWDGHTIRLNQDFRLNLPWWHEFFHSWDGFSFLLSPQWAPLPEFHVPSYATGLVHWDMVPSLIMSCLWVNGPLFRSLCQSHTRSCFLWLLHPTYAATVELQNAWSFVLTIWQLSAYYVRAPRRILT